MSADGSSSSAPTDSSISSSTSAVGGSSSSTSSSRAHPSSLPRGHGHVVWEMACSPESSITACAGALGLQAHRITLETGWDLSNVGAGMRLCRKVKADRVKKAWLSLPCTAWSCMQNANKQTPRQRAMLAKKRLHSKKMLAVSLPVLEEIVRHGGDFYFEWPTRCHGWRLIELQRFKQHLKDLGVPVFACRVDGCAYSLMNKAGTHYLRKQWTILTSDAAMHEHLSKKCPGNHMHATIDGAETSRSAFYPLRMAAKVALVWARALAAP